MKLYVAVGVLHIQSQTKQIGFISCRIYVKHRAHKAIMSAKSKILNEECYGKRMKTLKQAFILIVIYYKVPITRNCTHII